MDRSRSFRRLRLCALLVIGAAPSIWAGDVPAEEGVTAAERLDRIFIGMHEAHERVRFLANIAWPQEMTDPALAAEARRRIPTFGEAGVKTLQQLFLEVNPEYQADVASAIVDARLSMDSSKPFNYLAALTDVMWYGNREARLVVMPELALYPAPHAVLPIIDAVYEDPVLLPDAIRTLGAIGDKRARFFLGDQLNHGPPEVRADAAVALAKIGAEAADFLREAVRSDDPGIRQPAISALLPVATVEDLSALYDYFGDHPEDDAKIREAVRRTAQRLELALQAQRDADAAAANEEEPQDPRP